MVYPRVCGVDGKIPFDAGSQSGLSPRVRGRYDAIEPVEIPMGFIPACAG